MNKVYVLVVEWCCDYTSDHNVAVYATKELAQAEMERDFQNFCNEWNWWEEREINDEAAWCFKSEEYSSNHCTWTITEETIITGKEE